MARAPQRIFIKPCMTDVGRGPEPVRFPYTEAGVRKSLPAEGTMVSMDGGNGSFWRRRIKEGAVEEVRQPAITPVKKASAD